MWRCCDAAGFPLLEFDLPDLGRFEVSMFPLTKLQVEHWLVAVDAGGDAFYEELLAVNRRVSWTELTNDTLQGALATGLFAREALACGAWLGGDEAPLGFLDVVQYRAVCRAARQQTVAPEALRAAARDQAGEAARPWVEALLQLATGSSLAESMLLLGRRGVHEYVRTRHGYGALGQPAPSVVRGSLFHPLDSAPLPEPTLRQRPFGARLARQLEAPRRRRLWPWERS